MVNAFGGGCDDRLKIKGIAAGLCIINLGLVPNSQCIYTGKTGKTFHKTVMFMVRAYV